MVNIKNIVLSASLLFSMSQIAYAANINERYDNLGKCMAYIVVTNNVNEQNPLDDSLGLLLQKMNQEYMFEADMLQKNEDVAQYDMVNHLMEMNKIKMDKGEVYVISTYSYICIPLIEEFSSK